jgi:hypothetical protein
MIRRTSARTLGTALSLAVVFACSNDENPPADGDAAPASEVAAADIVVEMQPEDSVIFEQRMALAREQRLDTLDIGATIVALGRTFVGAPYTPATLEVPGDERLVVNLRELDCVTFVESTLAMARIIHAGTPTFDAFKRELLRIRYRDGELKGYPSRLHYFSEWIANNEQKGIVQNITQRIGGVPDTGAISFMTKHPDAYRQFADSGVPDQIRTMETRLTGVPRFYIPESQIAAREKEIRDGDVIAATSTLEGLDIAHTGLALWQNGRLHLMHAPLVGKFVEISEVPLATRIQGITAQDGIMVARPVSR